MYPLARYATLVDKHLCDFIVDVGSTPHLSPCYSGLVVCWRQPFSLLN